MKSALVSLLFLWVGAASGVVIIQSDAGGGGSLTYSLVEWEEGADVNNGSSNQFNPDDNVLLVVVVCGTSPESVYPTIGMSDSITLTEAVTHENSQYQTWAGIYYAELGSGIGNINGTFSDLGEEGTSVGYYTFAGYNTTTPVDLTYSDGAGITSRSGSLSGSLGGTSDSNSYVIGCFIGGDTDLAEMDTGTGWTQVDEYDYGAVGPASHHSYIEGAKANFEMDEAATDNAFLGWAAAAIEIQAD